MRSRATNFGFWTSAPFGFPQGKSLSRTILDFRLSDDNQNLKSEISQGNPNNNCITAKVLGVPSIAYGVS
ncbi:hypothetical protein [Nostoc sp.]|uniref:hypothetical protein n=1 Tax=Nostoc sp. TaxID=1180 RepID=UPI002FF6B88B